MPEASGRAKPGRCIPVSGGPEWCGQTFLHLSPTHPLGGCCKNNLQAQCQARTRLYAPFLRTRSPLYPGACQEISFTGPVPLPWDAETVPNACYSDPCLYVLCQTGSNFSTASQCSLYIFHYHKRHWTHTPDHQLPIPDWKAIEPLHEPSFDGSPLHPSKSSGKQSDEDPDARSFSRHFTVHNGRMACDVTDDTHSILFCLDVADCMQPLWRQLCACSATIRSSDCYCLVDNGLYHVRPSAEGMCCRQHHFQSLLCRL